jgi:uncharacterized protein DUF4331
MGRSFAVSHHLDTPLASQNGQLYIDDLYVFPGEHSTVFVMDVNSTITGPDVKPGFHPEARYEFRVHIDGADNESLTFRVSFSEPTAAGQQMLQLRELTGDDARGDTAEGRLVVEGPTGTPVGGDDYRIWAGRIVDSFYIDLDQLGVINAAVKNGTRVDPAAWSRANAKNSFADTTVESIVLEVSHQHQQLRSGTRIGVWCATKLATDAGGWRQINRAGLPMMWPIFWPDDTDFSNPADDRHPSADFNGDGKTFAEQIAALVAANGTSADPQGYGQTVAHALLPDVLPYVVGTPASFGFAVRNGRTLADNAPEAMFSLVLNGGVRSGLSPAVNEQLRTDTFPYVVPA